MSDEVVQDAPPDGPSTGRTVLVALGLAAFVVLAGFAAVAGRPVLDKVKMDRIVRIVVLDWRDFGREKAQVRLQYELDHQGIGLQVADSDCAFDEAPDRRTLRCSWSDQVRVPLTEVVFPVSFRSTATVDAGGKLE